MKIYELLKTGRELLGLTQKEVSNGIITESYYSKVERGIHQIDADDFFKLLAKNYILLDIFEGLDECIFDDYFRKSLKKVRPLNYEQLIEEIKSKSLHLSTTHYLSIIVHLSTIYPSIIKLSIEDKNKVERKKKKILKSRFNIHLLRQATTLYGTFTVNELLDLAEKSRKYVTQHQDLYTVKTYLTFVERFVLSFYTKNIVLNELAKVELKKIYYLCRKLLPNNYELVDQKINIISGIDTILYSEAKKDEIELFQEIQKLAKPNMKLIKRK